MAHKLAHRWRVFSVDDQTSPPKFVRMGIMDLRRMDANGILTDGEYEEESETSDQFKITGQATVLGGLVHLALQNVDRPERWTGLLIFDKDDKMKIGGSRFVPTELRKVADQEEEPWIITKP